MEDVCEGIAAEKKITAFTVWQGSPWLCREVRVRRQGKSLPVMMVTL